MRFLITTFTYDINGVPSSVQVGSDLTTAPRYSYSYNGHGDVVALTNASGTTVATYSYDTFGTPTIWESFTNGWRNPYLYDGRDGARYDSETGLYWLSVRAYDPTLGRFLSRDPLGRAPLFFDASQPYAYGGNNPLNNVDPSGQWFRGDFNGEAIERPSVRRATVRWARILATSGRKDLGQKKNIRHCALAGAHPTCAQIDSTRAIAGETATRLYNSIGNFHLGEVIGGIMGLLSNFKNLPFWIPQGLIKAAGAIAWGVLVAIVAVQTQLLVASAIFKGESFEPDSFWEDRDSVKNFEGSAKFNLTILGLAITLVGLAVLALASNPLTFAIGVGVAAGGLVGLIHVLQVAQDGFEREKRALGYNW